ncbi:MAG TPA: hypothetical protein VMG10_24185 [Gemmataceae bacterium]|nr:hypothetical protein [Gemmataceae bacterium]
MRISTWLYLTALCLIAGSLSLSISPLSARPPVPEPQKPLIHEEYTGYGKTEIGARNDALAHASVWLEEHSGLGWSPNGQYLIDHGLVHFSEPEDKEFEQPMGTMKVVKMQLDITARQASEFQKQAQHERMKERQKLSLLVVLGVVCLLGVVGGYLRLEEATKGYYTRWLRLAAVGVLLVIVAGLCVIG